MDNIRATVELVKENPGSTAAELRALSSWDYEEWEERCELRAAELQGLIVYQPDLKDRERDGGWFAAEIFDTPEPLTQRLKEIFSSMGIDQEVEQDLMRRLSLYKRMADSSI
jgi:hypothetical protein